MKEWLSLRGRAWRDDSARRDKPRLSGAWGDRRSRSRNTCTTTLTRVKQGVVEVQDLVKKKKVLVKAPKSYTARAKKK